MSDKIVNLFQERNKRREHGLYFTPAMLDYMDSLSDEELTKFFQRYLDDIERIGLNEFYGLSESDSKAK